MIDFNKLNEPYFIGEIGINHNGDMQICKKLIDAINACNWDCAKFQKRNPDICVPEHQKSVMRDTPWGKMTYLEYKYRVEFGKKEYDEIDRYCKEKGIGWFASVWDTDSVNFMKQYTGIAKIPSALITDNNLCRYSRDNFDTILISTGMSDQREVDLAIHHSKPDVVFHTNSTYPSPVSELNLNYINWLKSDGNANNYKVGYSGHEYGLTTTFAAVALGATWIERHVTLDRTMWGSDHLASVEPAGMMKLIKGIRDIESSLGSMGPREVLGSELSKRKSLRG